MKEKIAELLYHPDPAVRSQGLELAIAAGEVPLTVDHAGTVDAPKGIHGAMLRLLLEVPSSLRSQIRTLYLALDEEAQGLLPRLADALPKLEALHLLGDGDRGAPLELAPLADLARLSSLRVANSLQGEGINGLERLTALEELRLHRRLSAPRAPEATDFRALRRLRELRLPHEPERESLRFIPEQIESLHLPNFPDGLWLSDLPRFPLRELSLPDLPASLSPSDFPELCAVSTQARAAPHLTRWPLRDLTLFDPDDSTLRQLADCPTLRRLALRKAETLPGQESSIIDFDQSLIGELRQVLTLDMGRFYLNPYYWPQDAACPPGWLRELVLRAGGWIHGLPHRIRERTQERLWAEGRRLALHANRGRSRSPGVSGVVRWLWDLSRRESDRIARCARSAGLLFLDADEARTLQAVFLAAGEPAAIEPMIGTEVA